MKRTLLISAAICCGTFMSMGDVPQSFQEFRQKILDDYQEFRRTILDHYADFLEGTWHEYEPLEPMKKDQTPKPISIPKVDLSKPSVSPVELPAPKIADIPEPVKPIIDDEPESEPSGTGSLFDTPKVEVPPEAEAEVPSTIKVNREPGQPVINVNPNMPAVPVLAEGVPLPVIPKPEETIDLDGMDVVNFYGMEIPVPQIDFKISSVLGQASDFATHWKILDDQEVMEQVEEYIMPTIKKLGLNDYLTYEFLCAYMDSKFPKAALSPKISAVHYLMANMGYDVRIALAVDTGDPLILMPSEQTLYGKTYMKMGGRNYYLMAPESVKLNGVRIATCDLPKAAKSGKSFDLRINGLNFPVKERPFKLSNGNITLSGTVNENLMPVVYRYPQMDTEDFAVSVLDKDLRSDLVKQLKEQLSGKEKLAATDELLRFMHFGFSYATDDEFHGFEKPYFLEENLFYPKNDCEDRAIFYTYMLWNALGVDNQLLAFPGHESASVSLPDARITGTSYEHEGKRYYISDPTYEGSRTGQCMRAFETTAPTIDHTYSK